jgi:hypothetical protein
VAAAAALALAPARAAATGSSLLDCHMPPDEARGAMAALARSLKEALARDDLRRLRALVSDPLLVRLDGKKRAVPWEVVRARYHDVFGPRVRAAVDAGKLRRVGSRFTLGDSVVFLGLHQHGKGCGLEVERVFEEPPPGLKPPRDP